MKRKRSTQIQCDNIVKSFGVNSCADGSMKVVPKYRSNLPAGLFTRFYVADWIRKRLNEPLK